VKTLSQCPLCSSENLKFAFAAPTTRGQDKGVWSASECKDCGHQFMNPQPSWDELAPYYNSGYSACRPTHGVENRDEKEVQRARATGDCDILRFRSASACWTLVAVPARSSGLRRS
jgi:hypothetical protein